MDGYLIGKTEVTNAQYVEFLNDSKIDHKNGCQGKPCIYTDKESKDSYIKGTKGISNNLKNGHLSLGEPESAVISELGDRTVIQWISDSVQR